MSPEILSNNVLLDSEHRKSAHHQLCSKQPMMIKRQWKIN